MVWICWKESFFHCLYYLANLSDGCKEYNVSELAFLLRVEVEVAPPWLMEGDQIGIRHSTALFQIGLLIYFSFFLSR